MVSTAIRALAVFVLFGLVSSHPQQAAELAGQGIRAGVSLVGGAVSTVTSGSSIGAFGSSGGANDLFTKTEGGRPVVWRTCKQVPVWVNTGSLGNDLYSTVDAALAKVSRVAGVEFRRTRSTTVVPDTEWYRIGHGRGGADGYAPVVVAFTSSKRTDLLSSSDAVGGSVTNAAGTGLQRRLVTGAVAIDEDAFRALPSGFGPGSQGSVLLHELGHIIGLGHTGSDVMAPELGAAQSGGFGALATSAFKLLRPSC